jgi:hypothetical protein
VSDQLLQFFYEPSGALASFFYLRWKSRNRQTWQREASMNASQWAIVMLAALGAGAAKPALGQDLSPTFGSVSAAGIHSVSSIPDLSGMWGRDFLTFEPPSSGPGPILSKLRRPDGTTIFSAIGDYTNPILLPQAAAIVEKSGARELSGIANPNPHNQCWPEPTPFILGIQMGMQLIQHKDEVILLYVSNNQVRRVLMNAPHSTHLTPTWQGESVGHYEGDTLVIDTIGQKVGPLSMTDRYGTPFSGALHVIERYRLIDGAIARDLQRKHEATYFGASGSSPFKNEYGRGDIDSDPTKPGLQVEITVDDPGVFTTPWSAVITYRRVLGTWPEAVCAENMQGAGTAWVVLVPKAEKPAF